MENTGKILLDGDQKPQWFVAVGETWVGPMTSSDVYEKILSGEFSWAHFVWRAGETDWKRVCDVSVFQALVPALPKPQVQKELIQSMTPPPLKGKSKGAQAAPPPPAVPEAKIWFLYYNETQFGPFSDSEVRRFLKIGKIHGRVHVWKDGMAEWQRLEKVGGFEAEISESAQVREAKLGVAQARISTQVSKAAQLSREASTEGPEKVELEYLGPQSPQSPQNPKPKSARGIPVEKKGQDFGSQGIPAAAQGSSGEPVEQRKAPRRPLVARILYAHGEEVSVGLCRDVSVGGMQILTDRIPGVPGSQIRLNVSASGGKNPKPFVAIGTIVRLLEDGRGFSFRFDRLPEESRKVIEEYIRLEG